ncbi:MAG: hypothetical protein AAFW64_04980 [Pseudomonadota bacterium]
MSQTPSPGAGNGARPIAEQVALVIDTDVERHLLSRRAIRQTDLFSVILSAESVETARDILTDPRTPSLPLILVEASLADRVLETMTAVQISRTALVADTPVGDARRPVLVTPVTADDLVALLNTMT